MVEWQELIWQYFLQELDKFPDILVGYTITHDNGFISMAIDNSDQTYMFDMNGSAGNTSAEIAKNIAKDIIENYL